MSKIKKYFRAPSKKDYFSSDAINSVQMHEELLEHYQKIAVIIGADIFHTFHKKINIKIAMTVFYLTITFILNIYDVYLFRKDFVRDVFCILTLSGEIQSYAKIYVFFILKENCIELNNQVKRFHQTFNSSKSNEIFEKWMMRTGHIHAFILIMYFSAYAVIVSYPIVFYLIFDEKVFFFGIELPVLDWHNSWFAYGLNFFHHSSCLLIFIFGSIPSIMVIISFIMNAFGFFELLSILIKDLDELVIKNVDGKKDKEISLMINLIVENHLELDK